MFFAEEHKLHHQSDGFAAARCVLIKFKGGLDHEEGTRVLQSTRLRGPRRGGGVCCNMYAAGTSCVLIKFADNVEVRLQHVALCSRSGET